MRRDEKRKLLQPRLMKNRGIISQRKNRDSGILSFAQQRLWFLDQLEPESPIYNVAEATRLSGALNREALQKALDAIVARHEVLRTTFLCVEGNPMTVIGESRPVELAVIDLSNRPEADRQVAVERVLRSEAQRPFHLSSDLMLRAALLRLDREEYVLLLVMHHIASDGWSVGILFRELSALYKAYVTGTPSPLPELSIQYADFATWQRQWLQGEVMESLLAYWKQQMVGAPAVLELPTDHPRPAKGTFRGREQSFVLSKNLTDALKALSRQQGVTLFMTLLAGFQALLYRYTGREDIVVGSPIAGRMRAEVRELIGCFINPLVLRTDLSRNPTFLELLGRVRQVALGAYAHQDLPFEKLMEELQPKRIPSHSPLFQVMFVLQNAPWHPLELPGLTVRSLKVDRGTSKFDLTLSVFEEKAALKGSLEYNIDLFKEITIERMGRHFQTLLEGIILNPNRPISSLPILTGADQHQLLVKWNGTTTGYPHEQCTHHLFEAQVERTPDAVAAVFEDRQLLYRQLNERANQIAFSLAEKGIGKGSYVPILMDRSIEVIISMLSIMKTGAAFVPLDIHWPKERIKQVLDDLNSETILVNRTMSFQENVLGRSFHLIDAQAASTPMPNLDVKVDSREPIYAIYTSGSTGKPKAAVIPHRGITNRLLWMNDFFGRDTAATTLQTTPHNFDSAVWQLFWSLVNGGKTVIPSPGTEMIADYLSSLIERHGVTITDFVPSVFNAIVPRLLTDRSSWQKLRSLRSVVVGGEEIVPATTRSFMTHFPGVRVINLYGPTEASIGCICYEVTGKEVGKIPIGKPISNVHVLILDQNRSLVPVGVAGELYLSGICLGLGYLNDEEKTKEAFVENCFAEIEYEKLYKTGDLARWLPDGNIEFLGRTDNQVKMRGFRIELGEIETVLAQHPAVQQAAVVAREDSPAEKRLVAYVVPHREQVPTTSDLRSFLKSKLPEYMIPSAFVFLDALPLTPNGKVDRQALPGPERTRVDLEKGFVAPHDALELQLVKTWERVLGVKPVGVRDNFFELGGHSLLAVRLFAKIGELSGKKLPLATLFQAPTIEQLASILRQQDWSPPWSSLVAIQPGGSKPPFFCVHAHEGNVLFYRDLARYLGPDQPFYGLQPQGLNGTQTPHTRVEDMAAHYLKEICALQPEGPYFLGGYCFGGVVAFEMAQQLHAQGERIALLALFDSYAPGYVRLLPKSTSFRDRLHYFVGKVHLHLGNLSLLGSKEKLDYIKGRIKRMAYWFYVGVGLFLPRAQREILNAVRQASINYHPQVYRGEVTLFRGGRQLAGYDHDSLLGWGNLAAGGVEIYRIGSYEGAIFLEPRVRILAEQLMACLRKAQEIEGSEQIAQGEQSQEESGHRPLLREERKTGSVPSWSTPPEPVQ